MGASLISRPDEDNAVGKALGEMGPMFRMMGKLFTVIGQALSLADLDALAEGVGVEVLARPAITVAAAAASSSPAAPTSADPSSQFSNPRFAPSVATGAGVIGG
jgi:hypothetical protein